MTMTGQLQQRIAKSKAKSKCKWVKILDQCKMKISPVQNVFLSLVREGWGIKAALPAIELWYLSPKNAIFWTGCHHLTDGSRTERINLNQFISMYPVRFITPKIFENVVSSQRLFPTFSTLPSGVAVLFDWNLRSFPFLGQAVNLDLLLCSWFNLEHVDLFQYPFFSHRNQWTIERLAKLLVLLYFVVCSCEINKITFLHDKKNCWHSPKFIKHLNFLTLKDSNSIQVHEYCKSSCTSFAASSNRNSWLSLGNTLCLCFRVRTVNVVPDCCPKLSHWFCKLTSGQKEKFSFPFCSCSCDRTVMTMQLKRFCLLQAPFKTILNWMFLFPLK